MNNLTHIPRLKPELKALLQTMVDHLVKQRARATGPKGQGCRYRGENGRMCAVGCLIPDALYRNSIEGSIDAMFGRVAHHSSGEAAEAAAGVVEHLMALAPAGLELYQLSNFLTCVQEFHDGGEADESGGNDGYQALLDLHPTDDDALRAAIYQDLDARLDNGHPEWFA